MTMSCSTVTVIKLPPLEHLSDQSASFPPLAGLPSLGMVVSGSHSHPLLHLALTLAVACTRKQLWRLQFQERFSEFKHRKSSTKSFSHKHSSIMSMQPACCCICQENYNDREHCPRQLQCGHSICDICLRKLIGSCSQDSKRCPECRNPIR